MLLKFFKAVRRAVDGESSSSDILIERYQEQRKATRRLMYEAMQLLTQSDLEKSAKALGLWRRGVVVFDHEDLSGVLMNFALLEQRHEGKSTVERFRDDSSLYEAADKPVVDLICRAQFRLLTLVQRKAAGCFETIDLLSGEERVLVDVNLSETGKPGTVLATHVWPLEEEFWMTTGASVFFSKEAAELVARRIRNLCRCKLEDWPKLGPRQRASVVALIIRCSLETGSADRMGYA